MDGEFIETVTLTAEQCMSGTVLFILKTILFETVIANYFYPWQWGAPP